MDTAKRMNAGNVFAHLVICLMLSLASLSGAAVPTGLDTSASRESELFTDHAISRIRVEIESRDMETLRTRSRKYVKARVEDNSGIYTEVGIHLKGSTGSFRSIDDKPGLTLDFGRFPGSRKFHGLRKIHLNNSVEDPSFVNEQIGGELFRAAGVPAPRVTHALVELNGRPLGMYVLKEGFTEDFLRLHFQRPDGALHDSDDILNSEAVAKEASDDKAQADPTRPDESPPTAPGVDPRLRWERLKRQVDVDRFLTFFALEVMIGHRDGYCLARNNYRIYHDPETGKMVFLPHGMDQLFGNPDLPWKPQLASGVARTLMDTSEGRHRYESQFRALFTNLFVVETLTNRVNQIVAGLRPLLDTKQFNQIESAAAAIRDRIEKRAISLGRQLSQPEPMPIEFKLGIARLDDWKRTDQPEKGKLVEADGPNGNQCLNIVASPATSASWRTTVRVGRGRYRFEGSGRTVAVVPLPFGRNHGATLRVAGRKERSDGLTGDSSWTQLQIEFQVDADEVDVELVCELRADGGEAWFDKSSLHLVRITQAEDASSTEP